LIVIPPVLLIDAGSLEALALVPVLPEPLWTTVVVVVVPEVPLAMISAITPPAIAPPRTGIHRLKVLMV
jgi:hypothetical protein